MPPRNKSKTRKPKDKRVKTVKCHMRTCRALKYKAIYGSTGGSNASIRATEPLYY